jgi:hypothetical protein
MSYGLILTFIEIMKEKVVFSTRSRKPNSKRMTSAELHVARELTFSKILKRQNYKEINSTTRLIY